MAKPLNFNRINKKYLSVTLADEKETTLLIGSPTKAIMDDLLIIKSGLENVTDDDIDPETLNDMYDATAKIMSRNKAGVKITVEKLSNLFDIEDIMIFFNSYMSFMEEITDTKN